MPDISVTMKLVDVNANINGAFNPRAPNNLGPVQTAALNRLMAQYPAAGVNTVIVTLGGVDGLRAMFKFAVNSNGVLTAAQVKSGLK
jgi:hypothetical protein